MVSLALPWRTARGVVAAHASRAGARRSSRYQQALVKGCFGTTGFRFHSGTPPSKGLRPRSSLTGRLSPKASAPVVTRFQIGSDDLYGHCQMSSPHNGSSSITSSDLTLPAKTSAGAWRSSSGRIGREYIRYPSTLNAERRTVQDPLARVALALSTSVRLVELVALRAAGFITHRFSCALSTSVANIGATQQSYLRP